MVISSCSKDKALHYALDQAAENRYQLEKVLEHYSHLKDSSIYGKEKMDAAKFLIENMPGHTALFGTYKEYYSSIDSILSNIKFQGGDGVEEAMLRTDSLYQGKIELLPVIKIITANYLIDSIDRAFVLWKEGGWAEHLNFELFCEYILPFSCADNQPLDDWMERQKFFAYADLDKLTECYDFKNDPSPAVSAVNAELKRMVKHMRGRYKSIKIPIFDEFLFVKYPFPFDCTMTSEMATLVMRSKGLPVAIDFTPQWPDGHNGHTWTVLWSIHGRTEAFSPFWSAPGISFIAHKRFAKVFRRSYAMNIPYKNMMDKNPAILDFIGTPFFKDVSDEYTLTSDIEVDLNRCVNGPNAYLAVFDNSEWRPIWYGKIKKSKANFDKVGRDVTYMVMAIVDGDLKPVSYPFHLDRLGQLAYLVSDTTKMVKLHIDRKYPLRRHVYNLTTLRGGFITASNNRHKWDTLAMIPASPKNGGIVEVSSCSKYRYWRFTSKMDSDMAEIFFYKKGDELPIRNYRILNGKNGYEKLHDNDLLTFYSASGSRCDGLVDFGEVVNISEISYLFRGDGNAIQPGDEYQISYWDGRKWKIVKRCKAKNIYINVENAPLGALFYIQDMTRGRENRIFQWDNNKKEIIWN